MAEEIDAMVGEFAGRLQSMEAELADMESRLERLYEEQLPYTILHARLTERGARRPRFSILRSPVYWGWLELL